MGSRLDLSKKLRALMGNDHVYFQPPENIKMKYPAIVYSLSRINRTPADNIGYLNVTGYSLTYITHDPDDPMIQKIAELPYCTLDRPFTKDHLNHYNYTLYY